MADSQGDLQRLKERKQELEQNLTQYESDIELTKNAITDAEQEISALNTDDSESWKEFLK